MAKNSFKELWEIVEIPVYIAIGWTLVSLLFPLAEYLGITTASLVGWGMNFLIFGMVGYNVAKKSGKIKSGVKAGAFAGAITGFIGSVMTIIWYNIFPDKMSALLEQAVAAGAPESMAETSIKIGLYLSIIIGPVIAAVIGGAIAVFFTWVFSEK